MARFGSGHTQRLRAAGFLSIAVVLLLGAGWSALWFYAAREAGARTDAWIEAERTQGRVWTCPDRHVAGFPFAIAIDCDKPTFVGGGGGQRVEASLAHLVGSVALSHPRRVALALQAPFTFATADGGTAVRATWRTLTVDLDSLPAINAMDLHASGVSLDGSFAGGTTAGGSTESLAASLSLAENGPNPTLPFDVALAGAAIPALDALLGGTAPADLAVAGRIERADAGDARTPAEAMEVWRKNGGSLAIERSAASRAGSRATAQGTLRLDPSHRIEGRLDAEFVGLEDILRRYGISGNLAAVGSLVSAFFGGSKPPQTPGAIALPIRLGNGRLSVGPITTPVALSPLY